MYREYAQHYDEGQLHFTVLMFDYLQEVLERHRPNATTLIDLACGTGTLALMMADLGWDVLGIDFARAMLREAQRKSRYRFDPTRAIRFRRADMREWSVSQPVALVTCFYDSLNYLLNESDLHATFQQVWNALEAGGLWIFDINTPYFLREIWQPVEVEERDDYAHVMQSKFDPQLCISALTLTGFYQRDDGLYERFIEQHAERGYEQHVLETLLIDVGFTLEGIYDCFGFSPPTTDSHRWLFVCRKP